MNTVFLADSACNQTASANFRQDSLVFHADHFGYFVGAKGDAGDVRNRFHPKERVSFEKYGNRFGQHFLID